jgi:hypothetical protein
MAGPPGLRASRARGGLRSTGSVGPASRIALRPHDQTGEEIEWEEVLKGYEYERGLFVTLTPGRHDLVL